MELAVRTEESRTAGFLLFPCRIVRLLAPSSAERDTPTGSERPVGTREHASRCHYHRLATPRHQRHLAEQRTDARPAQFLDPLPPQSCKNRLQQVRDGKEGCRNLHLECRHAANAGKHLRALDENTVLPPRHAPFCLQPRPLANPAGQADRFIQALAAELHSKHSH